MSHIFISYSHKDKDYAHKLHQHLFEHGLDVWIDDRIDYGSRWPREIEKRLTECSAFILLMSFNSYESEWVQNELSLAKKLNKPIYPLLLDGEAWWHLSTTQYINVSDGKLPPTKFFTSLTEITQPQENDVPHISIRVGGNFEGNLVVGGANEVQSSKSKLLPQKTESEKLKEEAPEKITKNQTENETHHNVESAQQKIEQPIMQQAISMTVQEPIASKFSIANEKKIKQVPQRRAWRLINAPMILIGWAITFALGIFGQLGNNIFYNIIFLCISIGLLVYGLLNIVMVFYYFQWIHTLTWKIFASVLLSLIMIISILSTIVYINPFSFNDLTVLLTFFTIQMGFLLVFDFIPIISCILVEVKPYGPKKA